MYYAYVLKSEVNGCFYKGSTQNIEIRIVQHNAGLVSYTKRYLPWRLVYFEVFEFRSEAMAREKFFKTGKGRNF